MRLNPLNLRDFVRIRELTQDGITASVHLAGDRRTGEEVVLKRLRTTVEMVHEAEIHEQLFHPNIVTAYAHFMSEDGSELIIMMEYAEGGSLRDASALSEMQQLRIACGVARGLSYLHGHNILHNDLHPGNILLDKYHRIAFLCDFGSARLIQERTMSIQPYALRFAAPERGRQATKWTDVWSLGICLHFIFTGELPDAPVEDAVRFGRARCPLIRDEELRNLIEQCLSQQPEARPSSGEVLIRLSAKAQFYLRGEDDTREVERMRETRTLRARLAISDAQRAAEAGDWLRRSEYLERRLAEVEGFVTERRKKAEANSSWWTGAACGVGLFAVAGIVWRLLCGGQRAPETSHGEPNRTVTAGHADGAGRGLPTRIVLDLRF